MQSCRGYRSEDKDCSDTVLCDVTVVVFYFRKAFAVQLFGRTARKCFQKDAPSDAKAKDKAQKPPKADEKPANKAEKPSAKKTSRPKAKATK